ncbi:hypothetical protein J4E83_002752 [Alternaria metachromatica]|uniref:uncharacterized protein n=1 Tax=Alternaria metachromatica TaxID=283354 RepID=UPI0020C4BC3D|nr:uncharacterized protein J4E83_002752 [Alternaria metachromatica]KAI4631221.1 hypothetical protein J4E83_002752 [Alternaria metachromatica]
MSDVAPYEGLVWCGLSILVHSLHSIYKTSYLPPATHPNSPPVQWQISSTGATNATTVSPTATFFPEPKTLTDEVYKTIIQTETATRTTTTTATVPKTVYATVTEHVTSVSTSIDHHWLTKWTHYPIDPATPYTTILYTPDATLSPSTPEAEAYPPVTTQMPATVSISATWFPWRAFSAILLVLLMISIAAIALMWYREPRVIRLSGQLKSKQVAYETMKRSRTEITEKALAERATLLHRCDKAERSAKLLPGRDAILQGLGVLEADEGELDQETLNTRSEAKLNALIADKQRLEYLELENKAQRTEIRDLKDTITTQLRTQYVSGVVRTFDDLLQDKQQEITNLRKMINTGNVGEAVKESAQLHEEKEAELIELRPLRTKVVALEQALNEAKNETSLVQAQKKTQGVDDERRWNGERDKLRKEHRTNADALKAKHISEMTTLKASINTANCLGDPDLRNALVQADQKSAGLEKQLKLASQQVLDMSARNPAINPPSTSTIERDLRDQVHTLSVDVQKLNTHVTVLTKERDTAIGETTEAKSKGEEVYRQLQHVQAAGSTNGTPAATIAQYQADLAEKNKSIKDLQDTNDSQTDLIGRYRHEGIQEIDRRDQKIQQLEWDATHNSQTIQTNQQTITALQQRIISLENDVAAKETKCQNLDTRIQALSHGQPAIIDAASSTQIGALKKDNDSLKNDNDSLKKEVQAEKEKYTLKVVELKIKIDDLKRDEQKAKDELNEAIDSRDKVIAAKIAQHKRERQQEFDDLKNSQASSEIKGLKCRIEEYEEENKGLREDVKEEWKKILVKRDNEMLAKAQELRTAKKEKEQSQKLCHNFRMRWNILSKNKAFKDGVLTYEEVKDGLFMGSTTEVKDQMKKVLDDNEDLQAENTKLRGDVERLTWYHNAESVEAEMEIAEAYASDDE